MIIKNSINKFMIIRYLKNPLFKNSLYILLTSTSSAGFGFIFWSLAAKYATAENVGVATALFSSMGLIILISRIGLDHSIIRFIPNRNKSDIFSTVLIISTLSTIIVGFVYIYGINIFSPDLSFLNSGFSGSFFLIVLCLNSLTTMIGVTFVSIRKPGFQFIQSLINGSRIIFIFPLITFGAMGIFGAVGISFLLTTLISLFLIIRSNIKLHFSFDFNYLKDSFHFSVINYLSGLFILAPNMILPVLVLNILGAEKAAYYFIAFSVSSLLFMIPTALSTSLFVEGSHGVNLKKAISNSLIAMYAILIPSLIILSFSGNLILGLIGTDYSSEGLNVFRIMNGASVFVGINYVYYSIKRIQKDGKGILFSSGLVFILLISLAYVFGRYYGLIGIGYAWLLSYGIGSLYIVTRILQEKWI
jgi:O-antigen/teichoic acid export membrane protein